MLRLLIPLAMLIAGTGAGVGAGIMLRPAPHEPGAAAAEKPHTDDAHQDQDVEPDTAHEYVKLNNQFVVPIVKGGRVSALVVLALSLEVTAGTTEAVYTKEPKLRDAFLQVLFDHANIGGFNGAFTSAGHLDILRNALFETAQSILGPDVQKILIMDMARQDI